MSLWSEPRFLNEMGLRVRAWGAATLLVIALLLASLLGASGLVSASPSESVSLREMSESHVKVVIGPMTVSLIEGPEGLFAVFEQEGASHRVSVVDDSNGYRYSIDGSPWRELFLVSEEREPLSQAESSTYLSPADFHFNLRYWWDGVRFTAGYPAAYPHPDRDYYHVYAKSNWRFWGVQLLHFQFGNDVVSSLINLGPAAVGMVIGAAVGGIIGGILGAAVGALTGAIIGGLLSYYYHVVFVDETGAIWWWINKSLFTALRNIPWWLWFCGRCVDAYIAAHLDYLRVGTLNANNDLRVRGP